VRLPDDEPFSSRFRPTDLSTPLGPSRTVPRLHKSNVVAPRVRLEKAIKISRLPASNDSNVSNALVSILNNDSARRI
jgi:hypothetical protein